VIYGQEAFFDLLHKKSEKIVFPIVSVRDWPSIPWRERPSSNIEVHLRPGTFDAYVRNRVNFIDLRDIKVGKGAFGFQEGSKIDESLLERVITEAHLRGMFIYGTVECAVKDNQLEIPLNKYIHQANFPWS